MKNLLLSSLFLLAFMVSFNQAQICQWIVSTTGNDDSCATNATLPCATIQKALDAACVDSSGCVTKTVTINVGNYLGTGNTNLTIGGEACANATFSITTNGNVMINAQRQNTSFFFVVNKLAALTINGLTFSNASIPTNSSVAVQKGLAVITPDAASVTIQNCNFVNSTGPSILYWPAGSGSLLGSRFEYNVAPEGVAFINGTAALPALVSSTRFAFNNGTALVASQRVVVRSSVFDSNKGSTQGAIFANAVVLNAENAWTDNLITKNQGVSGAGLREVESKITYINCSFTENNGAYGGGVYLGRSQSSLIESYIEGNKASQRGGGLYIFDVAASKVNTTDGVTLIRTMVILNKAGLLGGGIYCNNANAELISSPVVSNTLLEGTNISDSYCKGFCNTKTSACLCTKTELCDDTSTIPATTFTPDTTPATSDNSMKVANQAPFAVLAVVLTVSTILSILICGVRRANKI